MRVFHYLNDLVSASKFRNHPKKIFSALSNFVITVVQNIGVFHVLVLHSSFPLIGLQNTSCRDISFLETYDNGYRPRYVLFFASSFVVPYSYFIKNGN